MANREKRFKRALEEIEKNMMVDDSLFDNDKAQIHIVWGDWKHSHLYADHIMRKYGFSLVNEVITEEDGADAYSAWRFYQNAVRNITEEDLDFLRDLQCGMLMQNTGEQADPVFWVVRGTERVYHISDGYDGEILYCYGDEVASSLAEAAQSLCSDRLHEEGYDWLFDVQSAEMNGSVLTVEYTDTLTDEESSETFRDLTELAEWMNDNLAHMDETPFEVITYEDVPKVYPDTLFLTRSEAAEHIRKNAHHYSEDAHPYAMTAWRSPQVERLYKILREVDFTSLDTRGLSVWDSNGDTFAEHEVAPGKYVCVKFPASGMPYIMEGENGELICDDGSKASASEDIGGPAEPRISGDVLKRYLDLIIENLSVAETPRTVIKYLLYIGMEKEHLEQFGFSGRDVEDAIQEMDDMTDFEGISPVFF